MFDKDQRFREVSSSDLAAYREAKRNRTESAEESAARIELELAALDAAIVGMDAASMEALREWADLAGPPEEERSGVTRRPG
jgi:hypothetical protein